MLHALDAGQAVTFSLLNDGYTDRFPRANLFLSTKTVNKVAFSFFFSYPVLSFALLFISINQYEVFTCCNLGSRILGCYSSIRFS